MKFFIDTANLEEIKEANDMGILDGVTTNPSLMAKEGIAGEANVNNHYKEICKIVDGPVSAEVISTDNSTFVADRWPFTVFVSTRPVEQKNQGFMTWQQLKEMANQSTK